jgi:hypothetical protein
MNYLWRCHKRFDLQDGEVEASIIFSKAVAKLSDDMGTLSKSDYEARLLEIANLRFKADLARDQVRGHRREHGC